MSEAFTIVMFVGLLFLFLMMAYGSGVFDTYTQNYRIYVEDLDRQLMASEARSEEIDPDELLHHPWRGTGNNQFQFLHGYQGMKHRRRQTIYGVD